MIPLNQKAKYAHVLVRPVISERAAVNAERNVYIFEIANGATKLSVKRALEAFYGVKPVAVNTVTMKGKSVIVRGRRGHRVGKRKAYVTLKKGDSIEK